MSLLAVYLKNWITNVIIQDTIDLTHCDIFYNPLLGNPNIEGLGICTQDGLYSASLLPNIRITTTSTISTTNVVSASVMGTTAKVLSTTSRLGFTTTTQKMTTEVQRLK